MDPKETKIYLAFLIGVVVLSIILIYFIITYIRQQKITLSIYQAKIQGEIITLEKERSRVSRDLHDELGPVLLSVKYNLNSFDLKNEDDLRIMEKTSETLDQVIARVREISNDLLPEALLRWGLQGALRESIEKIGSRSKLNVDFTCTNIPDLPLEQSVNVFRIVQEIIHNTLKHAAASRLKIELKKDGQQLLLITEDDGKGFNYSSESKEIKGLGLRSLLSRADLLNGKMYLDSKTGKGTRYVFEIPV